MLNAINLLLVLLRATLAAIPATAPFAPLVAALQAAITELETVQGSDVSRAQLEGLRIDPKW
jgi:hypothetical protein